MPNHIAAANVHPFQPRTRGVDFNDALLVLRREMSLLLIERDLLRIEVKERRAREDELRQAKEFFLGYVEWVEQLSVMEAETRKAVEFWQGEAQRFSAMARNRPHLVVALSSRLNSRPFVTLVPCHHLAAGRLQQSVGRTPPAKPGALGCEWASLPRSGSPGFRRVHHRGAGGWCRGDGLGVLWRHPRIG